MNMKEAEVERGLQCYVMLGDDDVIIISTLHPFQYQWCTADQEVSCYHLHNHGWYYHHHHRCSYDCEDLMMLMAAGDCLHFSLIEVNSTLQKAARFLGTCCVFLPLCSLSLRPFTRLRRNCLSFPSNVSCSLSNLIIFMCASFTAL